MTLYPTHSFLGATSDGRVVKNECNSVGLLEIKCPYSIKAQNILQFGIPDILIMNDKNFCLEMFTMEPTLKKTDKYYAQVQGEMAFKGLPGVNFVVWTVAASYNIFVKRSFFKSAICFIYIEKISKLLHGEDLPIVVYSLGICICHVHSTLEKVHACVNFVINKWFFLSDNF